MTRFALYLLLFSALAAESRLPDLPLHADRLFVHDFYDHLVRDKSLRKGCSWTWDQEVTFAGSIDWATWRVTGGCGGGPRQYFWVFYGDGFDNKTGQTILEVRVRQLDGPKANPHIPWYEKRCQWLDPERTLCWFNDVCIVHPASILAMSSFPISKQACMERGRR